MTFLLAQRFGRGMTVIIALVSGAWRGCGEGTVYSPEAAKNGGETWG